MAINSILFDRQSAVILKLTGSATQFTSTENSVERHRQVNHPEDWARVIASHRPKEDPAGLRGSGEIHSNSAENDKDDGNNLNVYKHNDLCLYIRVIVLVLIKY